MLTRVLKRDSAGPYVMWEDPRVPRVSDEYLRAVLYAYESEDDARSGVSAGGSGFLVSVPFNGTGPDHIYAVTNRHVALRCPVLRGAGNVPHLYKPPVWHHHPDGDDISVAYLGLSPTLDDPSAILFAEVPSREVIEAHRFGPGDEVFMTGRFIGLDRHEHNNPTVRFGALAMPNTELVWNQMTGIRQESFLVEMHSRSGYSGSPVIIHESMVDVYLREPPTDTLTRTHTETLLLGVAWGHFPAHLALLDPDTRQPIDGGLVIVDNSGLEAVVPGWKLRELILQPEAHGERRPQEDRWNANNLQGAVADVAIVSPADAASAEHDPPLKGSHRRTFLAPEQDQSGPAPEE